jgi:radical SAM superfamily enzyme YgiQ (UPF0313 family)
MSSRGRMIVLAAATSESSEFMRSTWRQMLLATLPAKYARYLGVNWSCDVEVREDGQAKYVPNGLRIIEALLIERFGQENVAVCYADQLERFIGEDTKAVGIHAHNPLGITFATDVYAGFYGADCEPINAAEFRRLILHPAIQRHKDHLKVILGGPGAWQVEHKGLQKHWGIDSIVHGEAEEVVADLFAAAVRGESVPERIECRSPRLESIPRIRHRATFGVVEITRGCGRGCQFCSVALRGGKSIPIEDVVANVRAQVAEGADTITITTEDLFLYQQGKKFRTNIPALRNLFQSIAEVPGVRYFTLTHGAIAPAVVNPEAIEELTPWAVGMSPFQNGKSTHPDQRYAMMFVGLETGSVRLFKKYMPGKAYPFRPEQWPDVVLKGYEVMNRHNWFPMSTFIIGLPGETDEDTKQSLELLYALKDTKGVIIPTLFVPLEDTRLEKHEGAKIARLTDLQWEFFFTCWRYNVDFLRSSGSTKRKLILGIPIYYYLLGRKLYGPGFKYPLFRLGHFPEWFLRRKLYLDFSDHREPLYKTPQTVEIPEERRRPEIPILA